jgi:hypothetical protein
MGCCYEGSGRQRWQISGKYARNWGLDGARREARGLDGFGICSYAYNDEENQLWELSEKLIKYSC